MISDAAARSAALDPTALVHRPGAGRLRQDRAADAALSAAARDRRVARADSGDHFHAQGRGRDARAHPAGAAERGRAAARVAAQALDLGARARSACSRRAARLATDAASGASAHPDDRRAQRVARAAFAGHRRHRCGARADDRYGAAVRAGGSPAARTPGRRLDGRGASRSARDAPRQSRRAAGPAAQRSAREARSVAAYRHARARQHGLCARRCKRR